MSEHYGVPPSQWRHWSERLALTADLLPVVCRPNRPVAKGSQLKTSTYGKVPCHYNHHGEVIGFPKWPQRFSSPNEIAEWSAQSDYGICLQTRQVSCFDIDIEDAVLADAVHRMIVELVGPLPCRGRANSAKRLLLFRVDAPRGKRVIPVPSGIIELLGQGNQCLVGGAHPSGFHYVWRETVELQIPDPQVINPAVLPLLTQAQVDEIVSLLSLTYGTGKVTEARLKMATELVATCAQVTTDPVALYLHRTGRGTLLSDEKTSVLCPWKSQHGKQDGDSTQSVWLHAGTGGYQAGHYQCLDSVCAGKSDGEFLDAVGWTLEGFVDEGPGVVVKGRYGELTPFTDDAPSEVLRSLGVQDGDDLVGSWKTDPEVLPLITTQFRPGTYNVQSGIAWPIRENVMTALRRPDHTGFQLSYDTFLQRLMIQINGDPARPIEKTDYVYMGIRLAYAHIDPKVSTEVVVSCAEAMGMERQYNSVHLWLGGLHWDGVPRVSTFYERYLGCAHDARSNAYSRYLWSAMAARALWPGVQADAAPIWIARQGSGKTSALKAMLPSEKYYTEVHFEDKEIETARKMQGKLIAELSELRGLMTKSAEEIKAFMTRQWDEVRRHHENEFHQYPRSLVMIGTTNLDSFLTDATGNRRYHPIEIGREQDLDAIANDRDQLWAEAACLARDAGRERAVLWQEAGRLAETHQDRYMVENLYLDDVAGWIEKTYLPIPEPRPRLSTKYILGGLNVPPHMHNSTQYRVIEAMKSLGYRVKNLRHDGVQGKTWSKI